MSEPIPMDVTPETYGRAIQQLTKERDDWKARAERAEIKLIQECMDMDKQLAAKDAELQDQAATLIPQIEHDRKRIAALEEALEKALGYAPVTEATKIRQSIAEKALAEGKE